MKILKTLMALACFLAFAGTAAAAEVFVHTKPWRTLTELKREAMAQRPWKGAKLRGAAAVAAAEAEAKT